MEKLLEKLFESATKVKILMLFFRNPDSSFSIEDAARHTRLTPAAVRKETLRLCGLRILDKKTKLDVLRAKNGKQQKTIVFYANPRCELFQELRALLGKTAAATSKKLISGIAGLGKIKLAVVSGFFINNPVSRVDLFIVGEKMHRKKLERFLSRLESETGKTLSYSVMNLDEFRYRMNMFDRFLRDIFEFPHIKLINRLNF